MEYARLDVASALLAHGKAREGEAIVRSVLDSYPEDPFARGLLAQEVLSPVNGSNLSIRSSYLH